MPAKPTLIFNGKQWLWQVPRPEWNELARVAGFVWDKNHYRYFTEDIKKAIHLRKFADTNAKQILDKQAGIADEFIELSLATTSDFEVPMRAGMDLFPYQRVAVEYTVKKYERGQQGVLDADDMGLGKTASAIGVINKMGYKKVLIICPSTLRYNWHEELHKFLVKKPTTIVYKRGEFEYTDPPGDPDGLSVYYRQKQTHPAICPLADINIVNYEQLRANKDESGNIILGGVTKELMDLGLEFLIMDEAHRVKSPDAQKTIGIKNLVREVNPKVMMLTGTPIVNRPKEALTLLQIMDKSMDNKASFWKFARRFCDYHTEDLWIRQRGMVVKREIPKWGSSNPEELQSFLRSNYMVRRTKDMVATQLPPKIRTIIKGDNSTAGFSDEIKEALKADARAAGDEKFIQALDDLDGPVAKVRFDELSKVRHLSALAKVPLVIEFVKEVLETKDKVVVFAHHKDVCRKIASELGREVVLYTGDERQDERELARQQFIYDPMIRVFVSTIDTGGEGLNLQIADTMVFAEFDWRPTIMNQAEDRIHRQGQLADKVNIFYVALKGTTDSRLASVLVDKMKVIKQSVDIEPRDVGTIKTASISSKQDQELDEVAERVEITIRDNDETFRQEVFVLSNGKIEWEPEMTESVKASLSHLRDNGHIQNSDFINSLIKHRLTAKMFIPAYRILCDNISKVPPPLAIALNLRSREAELKDAIGGRKEVVITESTERLLLQATQSVIDKGIAKSEWDQNFFNSCLSRRPTIKQLAILYKKIRDHYCDAISQTLCTALFGAGNFKKAKKGVTVKGTYTPDMKDAMKQACVFLHSHDLDRANEENMVGYNKMDTSRGNAIAVQIQNGQEPDEWEFKWLYNTLRKYHRQIPEDIYERIYSS